MRATDPPRRQGPILAGVDGGPGTAAIVRDAARLASLAHTDLVVAHVVVRPVMLSPEVAALGATITEADALAELLPDIWIALGETDVRWRVLSTVGVPAVELIRIARMLAPSAIVVGADTSGWWAKLRRGFNGSVPARLQRRQDAPVVVIPEGCSHRSRHADQPSNRVR